jgi:hypothetical protein
MKEIEIVLRNPLQPSSKHSYFIDVEDSDFNSRWLHLLKENLKKKLPLEKNYCFLGWTHSVRNGDYICKLINSAIDQINFFDNTKIWSKAGLKSYQIKDHFCMDDVVHSEEDYSLGWLLHDPNNLALTLKHETMNRLHRYFEDLQGEVWNISSYYKLADYETKYAIRQLNILCHELECWTKSYRQSKCAPEWQRPAQITKFLNAPRSNLLEADYDLFMKNRYNRTLGGVYLHWAQIGKTHWEVFLDENGAKIDDVTCSAISGLKYYSGEFDVEWGKDITYQSASWHKDKIDKFKDWCKLNNFKWEDPKLSLGYIKIGQVNLEKSFGTMEFFEILKKLSSHLDIYQIHADGVTGTFDYVWSDNNYKQMQIDFLRPGYDWSKNNA